MGSNVIIGIDFTGYNKGFVLGDGHRTFGNSCLHSLSTDGTRNPYEMALDIVSRTFVHLDNDGRFPVLAFGTSTTKHASVESMGNPEGCTWGTTAKDPDGVLEAYRSKASHCGLAGPASLAPLIDKAVEMVRATQPMLHHILVILSTGQVDDEAGCKVATEASLVAASKVPLSIITIGLGDGPWDLMEDYDDLPFGRMFDNFQFVKFEPFQRIFARPCNEHVRKVSELAFKMATLQEVFMQRQAMIKLDLANPARQDTDVASELWPAPIVPPEPAPSKPQEASSSLQGMPKELEAMKQELDRMMGVAAKELPARPPALAPTESGSVFVMGGEGRAEGRIYEFKHAEASWTSQSDGPQRAGVCAAVFQDAVYVFGGTSRTAHAPVPQKDIFKFDPVSSTWATVAQLEAARSGAAAVTSESGIFVLGGQGYGSREEKSVEFFRVESNRVERRAALMHPRIHPHGAFFDGRLLVLGGTRKLYGKWASSWRVEEFHSSENKWFYFNFEDARVAKDVFQNAYIQGVVATGRGLVCFTTQKTVLLDPRTGAVTPFGNCVPTPRLRCAVAPVGHLVYVMGGTRHVNKGEEADVGEELSVVEVFNLAEGDWTASVDLPVATSRCCAAVVNYKKRQHS